MTTIAFRRGRRVRRIRRSRSRRCRCRCRCFCCRLAALCVTSNEMLVS